MYTKAEIIEVITRQYEVRQSVRTFMINKLINLSDKEVMREFEMASKGVRLVKKGNEFIIDFYPLSDFFREAWKNSLDN